MIENRPSIFAQIFTPFCATKMRDGPAILSLEGRAISASYGCEASSYDIRLRDPVTCIAGRMVFGLALEHMRMPRNLRAICDNKSTNLRLGIKVAGRAEPGWHGHLTLEVTYIPVEGGPSLLRLPAGWGIAAIEFAQLAVEADYSTDPGAKYLGAADVEPAR